MSLLMEALKQQQQGVADAIPGAARQLPAPPQSQGWKVLALVLLVLVGLLAGFLLASWLQRPAPVTTAIAVAPIPASPGQILTELLTVSVATTADPQLSADAEAMESADEPQFIISANKAVTQTQKAGQSLEEQVAVVTSSAAEPEFAAQPEMAEADLDEPVAEIPAKPAELTAAEVSDELRSKFALALEQSDPLPRHQAVTSHAAPARDIQTLDDLLKRQIPPLRFEAHVYASEPKQRWVKVNGKDLQEGQWVTADIQIKEITPQYVLLQTGRQMFSMEALTEWSYRLPNP